MGDNTIPRLLLGMAAVASRPLTKAYCLGGNHTAANFIYDTVAKATPMPINALAILAMTIVCDPANKRIPNADVKIATDVSLRVLYLSSKNPTNN